MTYLYGDSSEANLDFNYLAFLREVIDCCAVLVECEASIEDATQRKRARENESARLIAAVEDLGRRATELVAPIAKADAEAPVGRCAASIATAIRDAVERETAAVRGDLGAERSDIDAEDQRQRGRAREVLEKLLRTHDLPGADSELDIAWEGADVIATMRQRTDFGVEAVLSLDVPANSMFTQDLRVDKVADSVELHTHESGGWLKKSDKLVALKLGRYYVSGLTVTEDVVVRLRPTVDSQGATLVITAHGNGDVSAEPGGDGDPDRQIMVEERDKQNLRLLAHRLEAAAQSLGDNRTGLVVVELDGTSITDHEHPRVLAERLVQAVAPTVKKIARHSRSPGELVLRRLLGDNRREEIFLTTAELAKRLESLPAEARLIFTPLELFAGAHEPNVHRKATVPAAQAKVDESGPFPQADDRGPAQHKKA